jgi:protein tyrosine phosphatase (PTP) superfamily phosphohydrolase (DUF442 family)
MSDVRDTPKGEVETRRSIQQIAMKLKKQGVTITTPASITNPPTQAEVQQLKTAVDNIKTVLTTMGVIG